MFTCRGRARFRFDPQTTSPANSDGSYQSRRWPYVGHRRACAAVDGTGNQPEDTHMRTQSWDGPELALLSKPIGVTLSAFPLGSPMPPDLQAIELDLPVKSLQLSPSANDNSAESLLLADVPLLVAHWTKKLTVLAQIIGLSQIVSGMKVGLNLRSCSLQTSLQISTTAGAALPAHPLRVPSPPRSPGQWPSFVPSSPRPGRPQRLQPGPTR